MCVCTVLSADSWVRLLDCECYIVRVQWREGCFSDGPAPSPGLSSITHSPSLKAPGLRSDGKSGSPPASLNLLPLAHLFVHFICSFSSLVRTLESLSELCLISGSAWTWPEVTLLVFESACSCVRCRLLQQTWQVALAAVDFFSEFQITSKIYDKKGEVLHSNSEFTWLCNRNPTVQSL